MATLGLQGLNILVQVRGVTSSTTAPVVRASTAPPASRPTRRAGGREGPGGLGGSPAAAVRDSAISFVSRTWTSARRTRRCAPVTHVGVTASTAASAATCTAGTSECSLLLGLVTEPVFWSESDCCRDIQLAAEAFHAVWSFEGNWVFITGLVIYRNFCFLGKKIKIWLESEVCEHFAVCCYL